MTDVERERISVLEGLASSDDELRRLAVERALVLSPDESIPRLVELLGDDSWRVRKACVERLAACVEKDSVVEALIDALADGENPGRRNAAMEALVSCGRGSLPRLIAELENDDVDVRKLVVDAAAGIGDEAALDAMVATLKDSDPNVRAAAADALGVIGGEGAARALLFAAERVEEDRLVRLSALRALARLEIAVSTSTLEPLLEDGLLRPAAFALLGCVDETDAVVCLLKGLTARASSSREAAMEALLRILARADDARCDWLREEVREAVRSAPDFIARTVERMPELDLSARLVSIQFLGLVGAPEGVVPILEAGRDEALQEVALATLAAMGSVAEAGVEAAWPRLDLDLRTAACALLARTDGEVGVSRLESILDDADPQLRTESARALGSRRALEVLPALVRRLAAASIEDDPDCEDEVSALVDAVVSLAELDGGASEIIDRVSPRLADAVESVRLSVARVVGRVARAVDGDLVSVLLRDPSAAVRRAGVEALSRIEPGTASEPLHLALADESAGVRVAAAAALGESSTAQAAEDLRRLVLDEDPRVRAAALRAAGRLCGRVTDSDAHREALSWIEGALDSEGSVAMAAVEALGEVGGDEAARVAVRLLVRDEPELVLAAVACIGGNGGRESLTELLPLVSHEAWVVRAESIQMLSERGVTQAVPSILRRLETEQDDFVRDTILRALKRLEG